MLHCSEYVCEYVYARVLHGWRIHSRISVFAPKRYQTILDLRPCNTSPPRGTSAPQTWTHGAHLVGSFLQQFCAWKRCVLFLYVSWLEMVCKRNSWRCTTPKVHHGVSTGGTRNNFPRVEGTKPPGRARWNRHRPRVQPRRRTRNRPKQASCLMRASPRATPRGGPGISAERARRVFAQAVRPGWRAAKPSLWAGPLGPESDPSHPFTQ